MAEYIVTFKQYLNGFLYILKTKGPEEAHKYCNTRLERGEYVLINTDKIPNGMTIEDIIDVIDGKFITI